MSNPPKCTRGAGAENQAFAYILAPAPTLTQDPVEQSPQQTQTLPLPEHLQSLVDLPWTPEASRQIDSWLSYVGGEFEGVGS